jgi:membrane protein DedA with SNARE-associated domain
MWENIWQILSMVATGGLLWLGIIFLLALLGELGLPATCPVLETLLIFTGFQIAHSGAVMASVPFLAVACTGRLCGSTSSYYLSRSLGTVIIDKFGKYIHITQDRINSMAQKLRSFSVPAIITARFVPGFSVASSVACGISRIRYKYFFTGTAIHLLAWEAIFLALGALGGKVAAEFFSPQHYPVVLIIWIVVMVIVGTIVGYLAFRRTRNSN